MRFPKLEFQEAFLGSFSSSLPFSYFSFFPPVFGMWNILLFPLDLTVPWYSVLIWTSPRNHSLVNLMPFRKNLAALNHAGKLLLFCLRVIHSLHRVRNESIRKSPVRRVDKNLNPLLLSPSPFQQWPLFCFWSKRRASSTLCHRTCARFLSS